MKVKMNVKSTSDSIVQDVYEYEDKIMTFREFLEETVKITVHRYQTSRDWNERFKIFGMAGAQRADKIKNIDIIKKSLTSKNNTVIVTVELIRAIIKSQNIGHIINGDYGISFEKEKGEQEETADKFAQDSLIPSDQYQKFIECEKFDLQSIKDFANRINRDPGIVLGRLQNDKMVDFKDWSLKPLRHKYKVRTVI